METDITRFAIEDQFSPKLDQMASRADRFEKILQKTIQSVMRLGKMPINYGGHAVSGNSFSRGGFSGGSGHPISNMPGAPDFSGAVGGFNSVIPGLSEVMWLFKGLAIAVGTATAAMAGFGIYAMKTSGDLDAYRQALAAVLGDQHKAIVEFHRLEEIARKPGLGYLETIKSFLGIYGSGADSRMSERIISEFGNLNALNGGGKEQLQNVLLAVQQMLAKGKVSAEEINQQLAEHLPQIREIMKKAFGTADIETIAATMGSQEFIAKLVDVMEELARSGDGAKNTFENFFDGLLKNVDKAGAALNKQLVPELAKVNNMLEWTATQDIFGNILGKSFDSFRKGVEAYKKIRQGFGEDWTKQAYDPKDYEHIQKLNKDPGMDQLIRFIENSDSLGDGIIRGAMIFISAVQQLPSIFQLLGAYAGLYKDAFDHAWEKFKKMIQQLIDFFTKGIDIDIKGVNIGHIGSSGKSNQLGLDDPEWQRKWDEKQKQIQKESGLVGQKIMLDSRDKYNDYLGFKPSSDVDKDKSKGGFRDPATMTAKHTREIADNTRRSNQLMQLIMGGAAVTGQTFTPTNLNRLSNGVSQGGAMGEVVRALEKLMQEASGGAIRVSQTYNPLR